MPNTLEQILGSQPNWRQQFADTSNQIIQDAKNVSLADYDRATGTYVPRSQRTNAPTFTQRDLTGAQTQPAQKQQDTTPQPLSYADMFVRMNPYRPQTAEEKEAERKRNRRNAVFAAIGDGISALSNLYFTTKGAPNAYTGGSTLTGKMYERQEQLRKERQALDQQYLNAYMNALRMDRQEAQQERNWKMQLENLAYNRKRQEEADARYEREWQRNEDRYQQQQADAAAQRKQSQENWERQFNATQANAAANRAETKRYHDEQLQAATVRNNEKLRGTPQQFKDANGNQLSVWGNVWKGSMPQVLDAILQEEYNKAVADGKEKRSWDNYRNFRLKSKDLETSSKQDTYVHNNWNKFGLSRQMMQILSQVDPAKMSSTIEEGGSLWDNEDTGTDW
ncbi:MAG: hypothetical protein IJM43_08190 [Bacteroidaceae bacterium]|nr:hypothetical protein [Bacteroidaceae bacterium]